MGQKSGTCSCLPVSKYLHKSFPGRMWGTLLLQVRYSFCFMLVWVVIPIEVKGKRTKGFWHYLLALFLQQPSLYFWVHSSLNSKHNFFLSSSNFLLPILFWFQSALSSELAVSSRCVILVSCTEVAWSQSHFFNDLTLSRQQLHALISFTDLQRELSSNFITAYLSYFCFLAVQ
jgi:hypothetical protein